MPKVAGSVKELLAALDGIVRIEGDRLVVVDEDGLRTRGIYDLAWSATFSEDDATDFLVEHTAFETANARAEVRRYTYTPGYQLSYLLGKVLILGLREEEKRRLGAAFSLKGFHDTLLRNGSLPISFHRRLLRGEG